LPVLLATNYIRAQSAQDIFVFTFFPARLVLLLQEMNAILFAAVFALIFVFWIAKRSSADPYGEFHLSFNKLPNDNVPRTEWLNMGYWKVHTSFPLEFKQWNINIGHKYFP
jgi:hypothetical protein